MRGFLARHPEFSVEPPAEVANALGERAYLFRRAVLMSDEGLLMTPRRTDTDGFFVSILRQPLKLERLVAIASRARRQQRCDTDQVHYDGKRCTRPSCN